MARKNAGWHPIYRTLLDGHLATMSSPEVHVYLALHLMVDPFEGSIETTCAEIGEAVGKAPRTVSDILASLEAGGYIERDDIGGRRPQLVTITKFKTTSRATNERIERDREAAIERTADRLADQSRPAEMSHETQRQIAEFKERMGWKVSVDNPQ